MKLFFYTDFIGIPRKIVTETEQKLGLHTECQFKEFLARFYVEGVAGFLIDEFTGKKEHDPETAVEYLSCILKNSLPSVLESMSEGK